MNEGQPQPGFLIIGAQKCGTSWLHRHVSRHPQIWMPEGKELEFFSYGEHVSRLGLPGYQAEFAPAGNRLAGEATASYFWTGDDSPWCRLPDGFNPDIPGTVRELLGPDVRLILSLRDPVERALSAWAHYVQHGELDPAVPFREAAHFGGIVHMGFYRRHIDRWRSHFADDRILILSLERDVAKSPVSALSRIFEFLDLDAISSFDENMETPVFQGLSRTRQADGSVLISRPEGEEPLRVSAEDVDWLGSVFAEEAG